MAEKPHDITQNVFPKFDLLPHPLRRIGKTILGFFQLHQLSTHGDHPFDKELYDNQALQNMENVYFPED